jgi:hypothetical protein
MSSTLTHFTRTHKVFDILMHSWPRDFGSELGIGASDTEVSAERRVVVQFKKFHLLVSRWCRRRSDVVDARVNELVFATLA